MPAKLGTEFAAANPADCDIHDRGKCCATTVSYMHLKDCVLLGGRHASVNGLQLANRSASLAADLALMEPVLL